MKRLYAHNEKQWERICCKKYFSERSPQIFEVDKGIILPPIETAKSGQYSGGVCDKDFNFVAGFLRNGTDPKKDHLYYSLNSSYPVLESDITYVDEIVIFGGILIGHFGHFILEGMGRLWFLSQNDISSIKIVFTTILEKKKWFWDFFRLLGLEEDRIWFIDRPTQFGKIIVPEESVHSWNSYMKEYLFPYQQILHNVTPGNNKKVYLTRTKMEQGGAMCCNEQYFEDYYMKKGFTIIAPEQFTIDEQISIIAGADEVVTTLGSLSHFAMFCRRGTRFTILTRVDDDVLPAQCLVNEASGVEWCIVDVSLNFLFASRVYGVNQIGVTEYWKLYIKDMYGETIEQNTIQNSCYEYLVKWCEFYSSPHQYKKIAGKDFFDFFNRMHRILCGSELDKKKYRTEGAKADSSRNDMDRLEQDRMEYVRMKSSVELFNDALGLMRNAKPKIFFPYRLRQNRMIMSALEKAVQEQTRPVLLCEVHVASIGWMQREVEGVICGDTLQHLQIEAIKLRFNNSEYHIYYSTCTKVGKWDVECSDGQISGTVGKHTPLRGVRIRLGETMANNYSVRYRVYASNAGWSEWKSDYEDNFVLYDNVIEAVQIRIKRK